jgi:aspartokinase
MITIPEAVEEIITSSPYLEDHLLDDLINMSSLARKIKKEVEEHTFKDVTEASIIMALKRYRTKRSRTAKKTVFKEIPEMIVRSNLVERTFRNSSTLSAELEHVMFSVKKDPRHLFIVTQGVFETTVITSQDLWPHMEAGFKHEELISHYENLSAIIVKLPEKIIAKSGVFYQILRPLALEGVNVIEVASTYSELSVILHKKDIDKAFTVLNKSLNK